MLVNMNEVLRPAKANRYAVGLFNAVNLELARGIINAAESTRSPVIMGTASALMNVLPDSTQGFRMLVDGKEGAVSYIKDFYGFDLFELPQAPTGVGYGMALNDNVLYIVSPAVSKTILGVMSTTLTNSNEFYDNADISQNFTMRKGYNFQFVGAAWAGQYTISE